ncbi:hypothetical protein DFP73DRAFT_488070 [Morchella snyderi]|nr:hypothetical protein DFP73DRAFT_488070 [Morchella snyderi]
MENSTINSVSRRPSKYEYNTLHSQEPLEDDPEQRPTHSRSRFKRSRFHRLLVDRLGLFSGGWRTGCTYCAITSTVVFLANSILTIWASKRPSDEPGIGILYKGSCNTTKNLSLLAHLIINVLSTLMLSASNYTMQCLSAPTRAEVDRAHARKKWLDIGVPSVRNLTKISFTRICLWSLLAMSSIPLHFMYNSAIFATTSTYLYHQRLMSEGRLTSDYTSSPYEKLTNTECIRKYGQQFMADRRDVILVVPGDGEEPDYNTHGINNGYGEPFAWVCSSFNRDLYTSYESRKLPPCDVNEYINQADSWIMNGSTVQYCLSERMEEKCSLQFSMHIMIAVIICNAVKSICMFYTVCKSKENPLVTVGDAVSSFLESPDKTTAGMCIVSKKDIKKGIWKHTSDGTTHGKWNMQLWKPCKHFWLSAASIGRWFICNALALTAISVAAFLLSLGLRGFDTDGIPRDLSSLWNMRLGAVDVQTLMGPMTIFGGGSQNDYKGLIACVLTANLPQAIFSFLYLLYNSIFTCMLLGDEWDRFSSKRRTLRVTSPVGAQRTTHFLQLPYKYSLPLMIASGTMHWLISQGLFLARINNLSNGPDDDDYISQVGWSPIAVVFVLTLGSVMLLVALGIGFRRYNGGIPLVGSCSAAISAACHPNPDETSISTAPLLWGVVGRDGVVGHCSFSGRDVLTPVPYQHYAGNASARDAVL